MKQLEQRCYCLKEFRADEVNNGKYVEGHAVVFNQQTNIADCFFEVIDRGAFEGCDLNDVALFVNHNSVAIPLAHTQSGTLKLSIDDVGLAIRAKLDVENNSDAKAVYHSILRGDLRGMSFAFTVADDGDEWKNLDSDMPTRIIKKFSQIRECSIVNYPAYKTTDISARSKITLETAKKELHKMTFEEFAKQFKEADERTARVNACNGLMPDGVTLIPAEFRDMIPAKYYAVKAPASAQPPQYIPGKGFIPAEESFDIRKRAIVNDRIQAGQDLKERREVVSEFNAFGERRTITLGTQDGVSASLIAPQYSSEKITEKFPVVSSLVEAVAHLSLNGGESFSQPYVTDIAEGGYTKEGEDAVEAETRFDYAPINRVKITAYAELTEELERLPNAAYADVVFQNIRSSILKVLSREILFGEGVDDVQSRLVGIFSPKANAINSNTDLEMSAITDQTLNEILYRYGGDEQVESPSCLILNKLDLLAFANVRTSTKQNFYDIQYSGNGASGTINGVRFIVDSACKPLISSDTQSGDYCMCYGNLANYLLCEFSPLTVKRSDDYRFRKGITCFRGSVICGGNVVKSNGFIRVKKK